MSTIASPREPSLTGGRRIPLLSTPTTSSRPSLETTRSGDPSPNRSSIAPPKRNRAALREYYSLKATPEDPTPETVTTPSTTVHDNNSHSSIPPSHLDSPTFSAPEYVKEILEQQSLSELLNTYNTILTDIRALDAEKKALVYDNYSRLILATETIRRMRERMGPVSPMAGTLDLAVRGVYELAEGLRVEVRRGVGEGWEDKRKVKETVVRVLAVPGRVRKLVEEGREEEARVLWGETRVVLERWKEREVGGGDVQDCIDEGDAALRGVGKEEREESVDEDGSEEEE